MELVQEFLEKSVDKTPDKIALIQGEAEISYLSLENASNHLAQKLIDDVFRPGDRAVIYLENCPNLAIALFGVLKAGGVFVLAHPSTKGERLTYLVNDAGASRLITDAMGVRKIPQDLDSDPRQESFKVLNMSTESWDHTTQSPTPRPKRRRIDIDLAALIYTSGSTGHPKGVMLTHRNMVCAADSIVSYLGLTKEDVILSALPMSFDYGLYQMLMAFKQGSTLVLERSFVFPHATLGLISRYGVTAFPLVPTMSAMLLDLDISSYDLSSLRFITNTGAALPVEHILRWRRILPEVRVFAMYGLTECKRVSYLPPQDIDRKLGSVGIPIPNTEVFIVNDAGEIQPPHTVGELVVRGGHVMQGYWRAEELTRSKLRPGFLPGERLLYTGDLFRRDEDGYLYFEGRRDDMIKCRGEKVSPLEIEEALYCQSSIAEAAVIGEPDPYLGQAVIAFITARHGTTLSPKSVLRELRTRLEDYKIPTRVHIVGALPKTPNGKIDKKALREWREEKVPCSLLAETY